MNVPERTKAVMQRYETGEMTALERELCQQVLPADKVATAKAETDLAHKMIEATKILQEKYPNMPRSETLSVPGDIDSRNSASNAATGGNGGGTAHKKNGSASKSSAEYEDGSYVGDDGSIMFLSKFNTLPNGKLTMDDDGSGGSAGKISDIAHYT